MFVSSVATNNQLHTGRGVTAVISRKSAAGSKHGVRHFLLHVRRYNAPIKTGQVHTTFESLNLPPHLESWVCIQGWLLSLLSLTSLDGGSEWLSQTTEIPKGFKQKYRKTNWPIQISSFPKECYAFRHVLRAQVPC